MRRRRRSNCGGVRKRAGRSRRPASVQGRSAGIYRPRIVRRY
ncbi:hypothetical protein [Lysobacter gummosus]